MRGYTARRWAGTLVWASHDGKTLDAATLSAVTAATRIGADGGVTLLVAGEGAEAVARGAQAVAGVQKVSTKNVTCTRVPRAIACAHTCRACMRVRETHVAGGAQRARQFLLTTACAGVACRVAPAGAFARRGQCSARGGPGAQARVRWRRARVFFVCAPFLFPARAVLSHLRSVWRCDVCSDSEYENDETPIAKISTSPNVITLTILASNTTNTDSIPPHNENDSKPPFCDAFCAALR